MKRIAGFTLIEILIAVFILAVVVSTIYAAFSGTFRISRNSDYQGEIYAMARITLERMTRDLEAISPYEKTLEFISRPSESGGWDNRDISFRSRAHLSFDEENATGGITTIRYRLEEDQEKKGYILFRDDVLVTNDDGGEMKKAGFAVCDRVQSMAYTFYDAKGNEYDAWDSRTGRDEQKGKAPAVIAISLHLLNPDHEDAPYTFATRVFIPLSQGGS